MQAAVIRWCVLLHCFFSAVSADGQEYKIESISKDETINYSPSGKESMSPGDCSFEYDKCSYRNQILNNINWQWSFNRNTNIRDHTLNSKGGFMSVTAKSGTSRGTLASLKSGPLSPTGFETRCLTFWYWISGDVTNQFSVMLDDSSTIPEPVVWQVSGSETHTWVYAQASVYSDRTHSIVFEAQRVNPKLKNKGFVAVDDIFFTAGPCGVVPEEAGNDRNISIPAKPQRPFQRPNETSPFDCNFDSQSLCGWTNGTDSKWRIAKTSPKKSSGPKEDHTGTGYFIYIPHSCDYRDFICSETKKSQLQSKPIQTGYKCLIFWYHMWGEHINQLNVKFQTEQTRPTVVWTKSGSKGNVWNEGRIDLHYKSNLLQITFEALSSDKGRQSNIALDDISLSQYSCDYKEGDNFWSFEDGVGDYNATSQWQIFSGSEIADGLPYPTYDHTYNAGYGHYISVNNSLLLGGDILRIVSPSLLMDDYKCIRLWYYIRNKDTQFLVNSTDGETLFTAEGSNNPDFYRRWQVAEFTLTPNVSSMQFFIYAQMEPSNGSVLAFDDIKISDGFCGYEGDCNFEQNDLCSWHNDLNDKIDWTLSKETDRGTGVGKDHTMQTREGIYLSHLIDEDTKPSQSVRIYSQTFAKTDNPKWRCLHFWFAMNSNDNGILQVLQKFEYGSALLIWKLVDGGEDHWTFAKVPFDNSIDDSVLWIESITGQDASSDVLIDDILISDTNCSIEPLGAGDFTTPTLPPEPSLSIADSLMCEFENSTCHWISSGSTEKWHQGFVSENSFTPPAIKPYIFIIADDYAGDSSLAELQSPSLPNEESSQFCFSFYYYVFGAEVGNLSLILEEQQRHLLWKSVESQYDDWQNAQVTVQIPSNWTAKLIFKAEVGKSGVMALDKFSVTYEACPLPRVCQFETHACQWMNDFTSYLRWQPGSGECSNDPGPPFDHTSLTAEGTYYIVRNVPEVVQNGMARFVSPRYGANFGSHCFSFWYYMSGLSSGTLSVKLRTDGEWHDPLWKRSGETGNRWHRAQVTISSYDSFQVGLEAEYNDTIQHFIAIDDLELSTESCSLPGSCNFDDGLCGYTVDFSATKGFDWLIGHGRTYNSHKLSGPRNDASGKTEGYYAYVDLTNPSVPWEGQAILRSDPIKSSKNSSYCLQFYYIQYGALPNFIVGYNPLNEIEGSHTTLWQSPPKIMDQWTKASTTVHFDSVIDFELLFVVEPEHGKIGFVGVDEIKIIRSSNCEEFPDQQTNMTTIGTSYYCDFESVLNETCTWIRDVNNERDQWIVEKGQMSTPGNHFDHTKSNKKGHFLNVERTWSSHYITPGAAHLCNPVKATDDTEKCFMFWYFMSGSVQWLNITLEHDQGRQILWQRFSDQGAVWRFAQIPLQSYHNYNICIDANATDDYSAIVAVDDVDILFSPCLPQKTCTFDDGHLCDFKQLNEKFYWSVSNDIKHNWINKDHTLQTEYGRYAYVNSTGKTKADTASLVTSKFSSVDSVCLKFWYYPSSFLSNLGIMYEEQLGGQKFIYAAEFMGKIVDEWVSAAVPFKPMGDWQLYIRSTAYITSDVAIAIDDVTISLNDDCSNAINCNFESVDCMWYPSSTKEKYLWKRASSEELPLYSGYPKVDHTLGRKSGSFVYIKTQDTAKNFKTSLSSSVLDTGKYYRCFSFWYYLHGKVIGALNVLISTPDVNKMQVASVVPDANNTWIPVVVNLPVDDLFLNTQIILVADIMEMFGILALDDIQLHTTSCEDIPIDTFVCTVNNTEKRLPTSHWCNYVQDCDGGEDEAECGSCTFEDGQCGYKDTGDSPNKWLNLMAKQGHEYDPDNAPAEDVTFGNETGHYMLAETHDRTYDNVELMSPDIEKTSPTCHLSFWMYAALDEHFEVLITHPMLNDAQYLYEDIVHDPVAHWKNIIAYVGPQDKFTVSFVKTFYSSNELMALDEVAFPLCDFSENKPVGISCQDDDQFQCDTGRCIEKSKLCDFSADCSDNSDELSCSLLNYTQCDFENSDCGWEGLETGMMWEVLSSGPDEDVRFDHTKGEGGSYMVANYYRGKLYRTGSPILMPSNKCKMTLYYYISANKEATFRVLVRNSSGGPEEIKLERTKNWGNFFLREEIEFDEEHPFQIILQANISSYNSFVAVDDISLSPECINITEILPNSTEPVDTPNRFNCGNGLLKPLRLVCDFSPDCPDASDEADCGSCKSTKKPLCGWTDSSPGMFRWVDSQTEEIFNVLNTSYPMVKKTSISHTFIPPIILKSPLVGPTASICKMKFLLQLDSEIASLELIYLNEMKNEWAHLLKLKGNGNPKVVMVDMGDLPAKSQIAFRANLTSKGWQWPTPNITIQDIAFVNCSRRAEDQWLYSTDVNCPFKNNLCNWYQDHLSDDIDWMLGNDYVYLTNNESMSEGVARLTSPLLFQPKKESCFTFSYLISGEFVDTLSVYTLLRNSKTPPQLKWNVINTREQSWRKIELNIKTDNSFQIMFEGFLQNTGKGKISIKDVVLQEGKCNDFQSICNFEADNCDWQSDTWTRGLEPYEVRTDHTTGTDSGSYLYCTDDYENDEALKMAYSPWFASSSGGSCLQIFYACSAIYGRSNSWLEILVHYENEEVQTKKLNFTSAVEDKWLVTEVDILPDTQFLVELTAFFDDFYPNIIAVDDIQIVNTKCQPVGSCNFETHQCGWTSSGVTGSGHHLYWMRSSGSSPSEFTGPKVDHTLNTEQGYYMLVEAGDGIEGYTGILESPILQFDDPVCLSLYYHMYGKDIGALHIQMSHPDYYSSPYDLYTVKGNQGDQWQLLQVEIYKSHIDEFTLSIIGEIGSGREGSIAIDDISVVAGACPLEEKLTTGTNIEETTSDRSPTIPTTDGSSSETTGESSSGTSDKTPTISSSSETSSETSTSTPTETSASGGTDSTFISTGESPSSETVTTSMTSQSTDATTLDSFITFGGATKDQGWIAGVVLMCLVVFAMLGLYARKRYSQNGVSETSRIHQVDNPCYDDTHQFPSPEHFEYTEVDTALPTRKVKHDDGIANPLYQ